ncbi:MAG TPA: BON domain-containing protein [Burkholderiales bacterium]|nr:BON domain-containing protein [Burkholderiales bacterium]
MKKLFKNILVSLAFTLICFAAQTVNAVEMDARSAKTILADQNLEHKVNGALSAQVPSGSFTVVSYEARILLAGQVLTIEEKSKAEAAVKNTVGVHAVWNYLTVGPVEDAGQISKDAAITTAVKGKLMLQKGINSGNIKVVTSNKVVYLLGKRVGNPTKVNKAIKEISQLDGVSNVVNLIGK